METPLTLVMLAPPDYLSVGSFALAAEPLASPLPDRRLLLHCMASDPLYADP